MRKLEIVYLNTVVKDAKCLVSMDAKRYNFLTAEAGIKEVTLLCPLDRYRLWLFHLLRKTMKEIAFL